MTGVVVARLRELALWAGAALGLLAIGAGIAVTFLGISFLVFRSGSMGPAIPTGSVAVARTVPAQDLRPGDVASVVNAEGTRITHRVVDAVPAGGRTRLVLQGDANASPDGEVYTVTEAERVWFSVPGAGYALAVVLTPGGAVTAGCLLVMLLVVAPSPRRGRPSPQLTGGRTATTPPGADQEVPTVVRRRPGLVLPVAIVVCVGLGLPLARGLDGTLAAFTDSPTIAGGTNSAGTVDLTLNGQLAGSAGNGGTTRFTALDVPSQATGLAPGESVAGAFPVVNNGTLKVDYTVAGTAAGSLAPGMLYSVYVGSAATAANTGTQAAATRSGTCTGTLLVSNQTYTATATSVSGARTLSPGGSDRFCVVAQLDPNASGFLQFQGMIVYFTFNTKATGAP